MKNIIFTPIPLSDIEAIIKKSIQQVLAQNETIQKTDVNQGDLLNVEQAADYLSLSVATIYTKVSKRQLPFMKQGKRLYFSKTDLFEHIKKGAKITINETLENATSHLK